MDRVITLAYNPTSWNRREAAPWPGGMVDAVVQPILPHLPPGSWKITNMPDATQPSVMFAFPHRYRLPAKKIYGTPSIFISHGVADKGWREPAKLIRWGFDYTLVSGPMWVRRFTRGGMHPWRVKEIGWPKLDPIVNGDIPRQPRGDKIRVLWAPTHGGGAEPRHGDDGPIRRGTSRRTSWHHRDMIEQLLPL